LKCDVPEYFPEKTKKNAKIQIGVALVSAMEKNFTAAEKMLMKARQFINDSKIENSRYLFLRESGMILIGVFLILLAWIIFADCFTESTFIFYFVITTLAGAFGAFLSVFYKTGKRFQNYNSLKEVPRIESICRIAAGVICAAVIACCIKAGIALSLFAQSNEAMIVAGFFAGMSERIIPTIMTKLERES